jgi:small-conductance mechanosensitive channel
MTHGPLVAVVFAATWFLASKARSAIRIHADRFKFTAGATSLGERLAQGTVWTLGVLIILDTLGVSIKPLLTALGLGTLAAALALQDTLTNLFAGIYLVMSEAVKVGDYLRLDSGTEGAVLDVGWRSIQIHETATNSVTMIPNAKLSQAIFTNMSRPDPAVLVSVPVRVPIPDVERAEKAALAVASEIQNSAPDAAPGFSPSWSLLALGESGASCSVSLKARVAVNRGALAHAFLKRLAARFAADGIPFALPERAVRLSKS